MNIKNSFFIVTLALLWVIQSNAQTGQGFESRSGIHDYYHNNWSIGAGFNAVDDSGSGLFGAIPSYTNRMSFSIPFYVNAEYYLNNMFSFNAMISFNQYKKDTNVDNLAYIIEGHEASYFAFDLATKLYFRDQFNSYMFDPYIFVGFGYTNIGAYKAKQIDRITPPDYVELDENGNFVVPAIGRMTVNAGVGFNIWFSQTWGLNLNMAGKWGMGTSEHENGPNSISNQLQYALGAVYFFN